MREWLLGVGLELISTLSGTAGKQLIRYSEKSKDAGNLQRAHTSLRVGLALNMTVGPILDMGAYAFAPQSLIAPFGGLDVVWNMLVAPWTLHERLTFRRGCSIALIFIGTVLSVYFGEEDERQYTPEVLRELVLRSRTAVYAFAFLGWFLLNVFYLMKRPRGDPIRGFSLGATAGTVAGNMFCVKATTELIQTSIVDMSLEVWCHWISWAMAFGAAFFAVSNVYFMTKALREYEALFMVTLYEGSMLVANVISACVVLGDLDEKPMWRVVGYGLCVSLTVCGLTLLVSGEKWQVPIDAKIAVEQPKGRCSKGPKDDSNKGGSNSSQVLLNLKERKCGA